MKGNPNNIYLVVEGPGKSGKDTVEPCLVEQLKNKGFEVVKTFEPGGTEKGMEIRKRLFEEKRKGNLRPIDELVMLYEAREYSMTEVVMPAMASTKKTAVLGLRNFLSSRVYQEATGTPTSVILDYHKKHYVDKGYPTPDLTLMMMVTAETAARRLGMVGSGGDAFDEQGFEFLKKISWGYGELAYQMMRRPSKSTDQ
jgi:dTMP kinase